MYFEYMDPYSFPSNRFPMEAINDAAVEINVIKDNHKTDKEQAQKIKTLVGNTSFITDMGTMPAYVEECGQHRN